LRVLDRRFSTGKYSEARIQCVTIWQLGLYKRDSDMKRYNALRNDLDSRIVWKRYDTTSYAIRNESLELSKPIQHVHGMTVLETLPEWELSITWVAVYNGDFLVGAGCLARRQVSLSEAHPHSTTAHRTVSPQSLVLSPSCSVQIFPRIQSIPAAKASSIGPSIISGAVPIICWFREFARSLIGNAGIHVLSLESDRPS